MCPRLQVKRFSQDLFKVDGDAFQGSTALLFSFRKNRKLLKVFKRTKQTKSMVSLALKNDQEVVDALIKREKFDYKKGCRYADGSSEFIYEIKIDDLSVLQNYRCIHALASVTYETNCEPLRRTCRYYFKKKETNEGNRGLLDLSEVIDLDNQTVNVAGIFRVEMKQTGEYGLLVHYLSKDSTIFKHRRTKSRKKRGFYTMPDKADAKDKKETRVIKLYQLKEQGNEQHQQGKVLEPEGSEPSANIGFLEMGKAIIHRDPATLYDRNSKSVIKYHQSERIIEYRISSKKTSCSTQKFYYLTSDFRLKLFFEHSTPSYYAYCVKVDHHELFAKFVTLDKAKGQVQLIKVSLA